MIFQMSHYPLHESLRSVGHVMHRVRGKKDYSQPYDTLVSWRRVSEETVPVLDS